MKISREFLVGLVFVIAIGAFVWGFNYLKGFDIFRSYSTFYAIYPKVNGLVKSNPVSINGMKVGQVNDIYFEPDNTGLIVVEMAVTTDLPIPDNSVANIYSSDLMGSKAIDLELGNSGEFLETGDTLSSKVDASLKEAVNQQIAPLKNKAEDLIGSIDSLVTVIQGVLNQDARANLENSIANIRKTLENLESASGDIDQLVQSQKVRLADILKNMELITRNISDNNDKIDNIIDNFSTISDSLAKAEIPRTFDNINKTVNDLALITDKINSGKGTLGLLINDDELYKDLRKTSADLDSLIVDINRNPKKYIRFSIF
ncbi:MAG: MlaD family protein [Bacteroidales bacterium]